MKFRQVYQDGCNGFRLGEIIEAEPNEAGEIIFPAEDPDDEDDVYTSRNNDGLYESNNDGGDLLVPIS